MGHTRKATFGMFKRNSRSEKLIHGHDLYWIERLLELKCLPSGFLYFDINAYPRLNSINLSEEKLRC